jgi:RNA-directed DNA polymerase
MRRSRPMSMEPAGVPGRANHGAGPVSGLRAWAEPSVWTARMLTALETGVKGGRWYSLIDKVYRPANLRSAFVQVRRNGGAAGVDHQTIEMFESRLEANLDRLQRSLKAGTYRPSAIRRVWIDKPGRQEKRPLGIPTVGDRVVQAALRNVLEPIFDRVFADQSYGFRPGRGCLDALRRVDMLLECGHVYVVDADLKGYFDSIPHERLMARIEQKVADGRVVALIEAYLQQDVMESAQRFRPEEGTPQGAVISPLLANIYLDPLDHEMADQGVEMVRYADDFVILCRTSHEAHWALEYVKRWTARAGLTLHPEKTRVVDATQPGGFDFLGYHFERGYRWPSKKSLRKLKDRIRAKTRRTDGRSLLSIISDVNRTLDGWFNYFQYSHRTTFDPLDKWLRMRLRSIQRKRHGGRGRGRGRDHQRWPNAFFADQGLVSLVSAFESVCQSARR